MNSLAEDRMQRLAETDFSAADVSTPQFLGCVRTLHERLLAATVDRRSQEGAGSTRRRARPLTISEEPEGVVQHHGRHAEARVEIGRLESGHDLTEHGAVRPHAGSSIGLCIGFDDQLIDCARGDGVRVGGARAHDAA